MKDLQKADLVESFINKYSSQNTRDLYRKALQYFLYFSGWAAEELVKLGRENPIVVEQKVLEFRRSLEERGVAGNSINSFVSAIKAFLKHYRVDSVRINTKRATVKTFDYIPTAEEVRLLIDRAPLRLKPAIVLIAYAGMRPIDVINLRFLNVRDEIEFDGERYKPKRVPLRILVKQQKTGDWYVTFLGNYGAQILTHYLTEEWKKSGKMWRDDDRLIYYKNSNSLTIAIDRLIRLCFPKHPEAFKRFRTYSLRKYFRKQISGILSDAEAEYLMGHVEGIRSLQATYAGLRDLDREAIEGLRQAYARAMPKLEGRESHVDKVELIKEFARSLGIENIEIKIAKMKEADSTLDELSIVGKLIREELLRKINGNGSRRYKARIVDEMELIDAIEAGCELVKELSNNRYLIRCEM